MDQTSSNGTSIQADMPFEFRGNTKEYFGIWIVNILLTIVTVGIYSAWAKVRTKRYFYGNTLVNNDRFDYLADPVAILKGWLIAIAIYIFYSVVTSIFPFTVFIFMVLFIIGLPWLVVRSLAFRARNTTYRNIRFDFNQSYSEAIKIYVGYSLLIPLTLGLAYPFVIYKQKQFIVDNSRFGTTPFSFFAKIKDFYKVYAVFAIGLLLFMAAFYLVFLEQANNLSPSIDNTPEFQDRDTGSQQADPLVVFALMTSLWAFMLISYGYLQARIQNLFWNNAEIDKNQFNSTLRARDMIWIYFSNAIAVVLTIGLMIPWTKIRLARYRMNHLSLLANNDLNKFIAGEEASIKAIGEEIGEVFDVDIGI